MIILPSKEQHTLLSGPCGAYCSNYDAEIIAIQKTLDALQQQFERGSTAPTDTVLLTHCQQYRPSITPKATLQRALKTSSSLAIES